MLLGGRIPAVDDGHGWAGDGLGDAGKVEGGKAVWDWFAPFQLGERLVLALGLAVFDLLPSALLKVLRCAALGSDEMQPTSTVALEIVGQASIMELAIFPS